MTILSVALHFLCGVSLLLSGRSRLLESPEERVRVLIEAIMGGAMLVATVCTPIATPTASLALPLMFRLRVPSVASKSWSRWVLRAGFGLGLVAIAALEFPALFTAAIARSGPQGLDEEIVPAELVRVFEEETPEMFTSIAADQDGNFYITLMSRSEIRRLGRDGSISTVVKLPAGEFDLWASGGPTGVVGSVVVGSNGELFATLLATSAENRGIWKIDPKTSAARLLATMPLESLPNGITATPSGDLYVADSTGAIWRLLKGSGEAQVWSRDPLLQKEGFEILPGANGLRFYGNDLYVTNPSTGNVLRVPLEPDGSAGAATIFIEGLPGDEFAIDVNGSFYITTHIHNSVVRVDPDGRRSVIATASEGLVGPTAAAFGMTPETRGQLYVIGDGGYMLPRESTAPMIVRLDVGVDGYPIAQEYDTREPEPPPP